MRRNWGIFVVGLCLGWVVFACKIRLEENSTLAGSESYAPLLKCGVIYKGNIVSEKGLYFQKEDEAMTYYRKFSHEEGSSVYCRKVEYKKVADL